jgi:tRNA pseudouridine65 synthase
LEILYQDEELVAVNKPHGLLVHRSMIAADTSEFAVQILRDQIGRKVFPVHRLDRKTAGVLLFALTDQMNREMQMQFQEGKVQKHYHAIVRGFTPDSLEIDYPLKRDDGLVQDAFTAFTTIKKVELPLPFGHHATSRYSLVDLHPATGRMHQLRKHMAHIGDRPHGCNKQNRFFKEHFQMDSMLLHARQIQFEHPVLNQTITISADYQPEFKRMLQVLEFNS